MEEELIDDSLDYEEYDLDEEQEEALLAEDQETDDLVQVSSGLKSSYQVHNDHYGNQVEIDDTSQYENEDVDDAGHYANQVEVDDSNYADEEGVNEQDNYVDYQEGDMEEQGDGAELLEHDALEEGDPDDEEEEEEEGRGRDRFKSERTKISLITVGNTQREIPDSLDDVIQPSDASNQKNWRGKGKGRGRGRGQNRGMQQQQQQRKILNAPRRQQWPGQQPQFFQQFPNGPPMRMQPPSFHQFNPQPRPLMPMPGPPFQRLQGPNVFFNGPMFQDFTEDMNGEMFLAPNPSQKRGDPFSQGPHMNNNNMYPNATRGRGQNFQNASRGRGQNLPNASRGMGQNQPNASRGRGQNQPNASRGMGQNQPNASRGWGQNQPNASPGRGQNQPNASRGRGGVAKHIPVHQRLSRPQPSDNVKGKNQNQNKSNLQEVPCKTIPKSPANKVPEKPPSPKLSEEELYQKRLEEQKAQRAKVLAMKEARRKETMEKEEESSTADAAPNSVAPKQAAPNPAASTPVAPKPVTAKPVAPKPAAPKPAAPQAVTAKPVVPKPAAPKPIQQNISVVLNTKTGPPKKKALARLGGPRPLHPKPQPIQQGHFNPRAGPPIVRQNMPRMGQMPPPRMSNSNISRPPLSHPQAAGQRFQMNPPNQFSQGIHPRAPAPFSTRLEPLHMAAPIRSNLPPLQSHSSLMQSRPPIHTRPPLQQRLMPPAPLPARHIQQNNSPYPDARPSPNLARPPPNFNGPSSSMGPRGPSPHQPPMSDVYARSETQFQRPAHHLPQGPPLHGSPLQRPPLQRAPPQHSPLQRPAPQLHPQQRAPPQRPPQQRPPPSYSFSNEQGYSEYDNVQRGYPQNNREWDQYDDRSYEVPSDGYDHYGNEVPMKTHPRPHPSELTQFSQGYAPSSMEPSPDLRSKLNFRGPLRQTVAVAQAPTQTAPPPKPAPKMISTQKIQKRFKKIIRRNKNGDIISIKKVPLDGEGNPVGQEKYEFVNEDLLSFNTGGSAKRMKVMSPQEQGLNRPVKRVLQRPAVGPSGNGLSLRDGLPPTQFTRELAESAQRITSLVGRRHDDQANFQRMPSGDGRSLQPSGPTRRVIAEFPRGEGAYPGRDFAVKLTPLPPRVRIQDLLQDSREQHKMMEFDDRLRQYKLSFHTHESAVRFCHFVNDLGIEISAFLVSA